MDIFASRAERDKQYKLQGLAPKIVKSYPGEIVCLECIGGGMRGVAPTRAELQRVYQKPDINPALKKSLAKKRRKRRRVRNIRGELAQIKRAQKRFEEGERRHKEILDAAGQLTGRREYRPEQEPRLVADPEPQRGININFAGPAGAAAGGAVPPGVAPAVPPAGGPVVPPGPPVVPPGAPVPVPPVPAPVPAVDVDALRAAIRADIGGDIRAIRPGIRAELAAEMDELLREARRARAAAEQGLRAGAAQTAAAREAAAQAEHVRQGIIEQQVAAQEREQAIAARDGEQVGALRAQLAESNAIIAQLRDNQGMGEAERAEQIAEERRRYDALHATIQELAASNEGIRATMVGAGGLVRREVGEDLTRFDATAAQQAEAIRALGERLEGHEAELRTQREAGQSARQAGQAEREAAEQQRQQEFRLFVDAIEARLGAQDEGLQQTLARVREGDERRPGEFQRLLEEQVGALEGRLGAGLQEQIAAAIAEGRQRREDEREVEGETILLHRDAAEGRAGGIDLDAIILSELDADKRDAAEGRAGGVSTLTGPGPVNSDGLNTTLRDSALSQTPAEIQGTLGAGNVITDSQRAAFEAGFERPRGEGGGGKKGGKKGGKGPVVAKGTRKGRRSPGRRVYSPGGTDITEDPQVRGKVGKVKKGGGKAETPRGQEKRVVTEALESGRRGRSPRRSRRSGSPRKGRGRVYSPGGTDITDAPRAYSPGGTDITDPPRGGRRSPRRGRGRVYSPGGTDITDLPYDERLRRLHPGIYSEEGRRVAERRRLRELETRRSPRRGRRSPRKSRGVGGNTDDRRSTGGRRRSDDFESEPEADGIGGHKTTTSGKRRSRKPKEGEPTYDDLIGGKKPGRRRTESITDEEIRHSQSLMDETITGLTGGGRRGRGLVGRLRVKNTYDTSWGESGDPLLEGEDIVDIMGSTAEGGVRLRGTGKAAGKVIPLSVLEEGVRRGDVVLEKGQRRDLGGWWKWSPFRGQEGRQEYERLYREEARRTKSIYKTDDDAVLRARGHQTVEERVNAKLQKELDQQRRTEERRKADRDQMRLDDLRHTTTIAQNRRQTAAETAEDIMAVEEQAQRREASAAVSEEEQHKRAQKSVVGREAERLYEFVPDVPAAPSAVEGLTIEPIQPREGVEEEVAGATD